MLGRRWRREGPFEEPPPGSGPGWRGGHPRRKRTGAGSSSYSSTVRVRAGPGAGYGGGSSGSILDGAIIGKGSLRRGRIREGGDGGGPIAVAGGNGLTITLAHGS